MVAAAPVLPVGYVVSASWIADQRMILTGYRLADLLTRVTQTLIEGEYNSVLASLDHLIRPVEHGLWNIQADLFGRIEIDH